MSTMRFERPIKDMNFKAKWTGICVYPNDGLTVGKEYEVIEQINSDALMRPVKVVNDRNQLVYVFASRFREA
ncbi:hypothetical protein D3C80_2073770 [compost metagenome]